MSVIEIIEVLTPGLLVVLQVAALSSLITIVLSTAMAVALNSEIHIVRVMAKTYVRVFRSIPILAMMMLIFFGIGALSPLLNISAFWSAVIAITIVEVAFTGAVYKGAIDSIDTKQWEAGKSLGLSRFKIYQHIILKQAVLPALPLTLNMMMWVIKATALGSLITLNELTLRANAIIIQHAQPLLVYSVVLFSYVIFTVPLGYLGRWTESILKTKSNSKVKISTKRADALKEVRVG